MYKRRRDSKGRFKKRETSVKAKIIKKVKKVKKKKEVRKGTGRMPAEGFYVGKNYELSDSKEFLSAQRKVARFGITNNFEYRKTVEGKEAVVVGHCSMPQKICYQNLWRAILKSFMKALGIDVVDFSMSMLVYGFVAGDKIRFNFFGDTQTNQLNSDVYNIVAASTFDAAATSLTVATAGWIAETRPESIELLPEPTSRFSGGLLRLTGLKVNVWTKSVLKLQNVTVQNNTDNESDDVNSVPLEGKLYTCYGNNFVKKQNNHLLHGLFDQQHDDALYGTYDVIGSTEAGMSHYRYLIADTQSTFYKPAEPPKVWEIKNCKGSTKMYVPPGGIKTSILKSNFEMTLDRYVSLLCQDRGLIEDKLVYNEKRGKTNVFYLEKVIGQHQTEQNNIKTWVELDFKQSVSVSLMKPAQTNPIEYQHNF